MSAICGVASPKRRGCDVGAVTDGRYSLVSQFHAPVPCLQTDCFDVTFTRTSMESSVFVDGARAITDCNKSLLKSAARGHVKVNLACLSKSDLGNLFANIGPALPSIQHLNVYIPCQPPSRKQSRLPVNENGCLEFPSAEYDQAVKDLSNRMAGPKMAQILRTFLMSLATDATSLMTFICNLPLPRPLFQILTQAVSGMPSLLHLSLKGSQIGDEAVQHLCSTLQQAKCGVTHLDLSGCWLTDCSATTIAALMKAEALEFCMERFKAFLREYPDSSLAPRIRNILFQRRAAALTAELRSSCPGLVCISLHHNSVTDTGAVALFDAAVTSSTIESIGLCGNRLSMRAGRVARTVMTEHDTLREVDMRSNCALKLGLLRASHVRPMESASLASGTRAANPGAPGKQAPPPAAASAVPQAGADSSDIHAGGRGGEVVSSSGTAAAHACVSTEGAVHGGQHAVMATAMAAVVDMFEQMSADSTGQGALCSKRPEGGDSLMMLRREGDCMARSQRRCEAGCKPARCRKQPAATPASVDASAVAASAVGSGALQPATAPPERPKGNPSLPSSPGLTRQAGFQMARTPHLPDDRGVMESWVKDGARGCRREAGGVSSVSSAVAVRTENLSVRPHADDDLNGDIMQLSSWRRGGKPGDDAAAGSDALDDHSAQHGRCAADAQSRPAREARLKAKAGKKSKFGFIPAPDGGVSTYTRTDAAWRAPAASSTQGCSPTYAQARPHPTARAARRAHRVILAAPEHGRNAGHTRYAEASTPPLTSAKPRRKANGRNAGKACGKRGGRAGQRLKRGCPPPVVRPRGEGPAMRTVSVQASSDGGSGSGSVRHGLAALRGADPDAFISMHELCAWERQREDAARGHRYEPSDVSGATHSEERTPPAGTLGGRTPSAVGVVVGSQEGEELRTLGGAGSDGCAEGRAAAEVTRHGQPSGLVEASAEWQRLEGGRLWKSQNAACSTRTGLAAAGPVAASGLHAHGPPLEQGTGAAVVETAGPAVDISIGRGLHAPEPARKAPGPAAGRCQESLAVAQGVAPAADEKPGAAEECCGPEAAEQRDQQQRLFAQQEWKRCNDLVADAWNGSGPAEVERGSSSRCADTEDAAETADWSLGGGAAGSDASEAIRAVRGGMQCVQACLLQLDADAGLDRPGGLGAPPVV
eukprot:jgi/Ulvmu1/9412/UM051_0040.1